MEVYDWFENDPKGIIDLNVKDKGENSMVNFCMEENF